MDTGVVRAAVLMVGVEVASDGRCMAHVLELPGCTVRAGTRDEALSRVPQAIREHLGWLARHGEAVEPAADLPAFVVVAESEGSGPFDPGDAAALFPADLEPVSRAEMEHFFRLLAFSRADLLALVGRLPDEVLDRVPGEGSFTIRRLLRHVGNAEEWYVSRIVPPERLPEEWKDDESLPIWEFLEMERRTALDRLRQLDEAQRSGTYHPSAWTAHPEEGWTARKVLRRFAEHEREHTHQIAALLAGFGMAPTGA